jgi:hypothetical protein
MSGKATPLMYIRRGSLTLAALRMMIADCPPSSGRTADSMVMTAPAPDVSADNIF